MAKNFSKEQTQEIRDIIRSTLNNYQGHIRMNGGVLKAVNSKISSTVISLAPGSNIQNAINNLPSTGGIIFLQSGGTFFPTNDIILNEHVYIQGENISGTVVDFGNNPYGFRIKGTNVYNTGTVSVNVGSQSVTGSGTNWTTAMIGQQIFLSGYNYNILTVPSATSLTIDQQYTSPGLSGNLSGASYAIANAIQGVQLSDFTIQNSSDKAIDAECVADVVNITNVEVYTSNYGIYANQCAGFNYIDGYIEACNYGAYFYNCDNITWSESSSYDIVIGDGIRFDTSGDSSIFNFACSNCNGNGISFNNAFNTDVGTGTINDNTGNGIELIAGSNSILVNQCGITGNGGSGVKLTATALYGIFAENVIGTNGAYDFNIANANCQYNILSANVCLTSTSGFLNDSGTLTKCRGNVNITDKN